MIIFVGIIGILEGLLLIFLNKKNKEECAKNERIQGTVTDLMTGYWKLVIDYEVESPMEYLDFVRNVQIADVTKKENYKEQIEQIFYRRKKEGKWI